MSQRQLVVPLVLIGIVLLAHPTYLPVPAGEIVHPTFEQTSADKCSSTVAYTDLPPRAKRSFKITSHSDLPKFNDTLYTRQDAEAVTTFQNHDCVHRNGHYFSIGLIRPEGAPALLPSSTTLLSLALYSIGGLALLGAMLVFWKK